MIKMLTAVSCLLLGTFLLAEESESNRIRPGWMPAIGEEVTIRSVNSTDYVIEADGIPQKVYRAVKVMTTERKQVFLFQIKPDSPAVLIRDGQGMITEIWLLPADYPVLED